MVKTLENQTIVILGGSAGIGYGVAKHFLETTKARVVIGSSTTKRVEGAVASLSKLDGSAGRITGHAVDLDTSTSEDSITQFFATIGPFDHLIYTAADSLLMIPITEISKAAGEKAFGIRYWSLLTTIRLALPHMPQSPDSSITLTSGNVVNRPMKGWGAAMSGIGSAVEGLTRGLAVDLAPVRVNCVAPGAIPETDLWAGVPKDTMAEMMEGWKKKSLTGRLGTVEDVAEGYAYLVRGGFTTGQTIFVEGGEYLV
jgi:NAD(P)-dependent dehydrogenase (short-subunit alcohol dehydrogenase family)